MTSAPGLTSGRAFPTGRSGSWPPAGVPTPLGRRAQRGGGQNPVLHRGDYRHYSAKACPRPLIPATSAGKSRRCGPPQAPGSSSFPLIQVLPRLNLLLSTVGSIHLGANSSFPGQLPNQRPTAAAIKVLRCRTRRLYRHRCEDDACWPARVGILVAPASSRDTVDAASIPVAGNHPAESVEPKLLVRLSPVGYF